MSGLALPVRGLATDMLGARTNLRRPAHSAVGETLLTRCWGWMPVFEAKDRASGMSGALRSFGMRVPDEVGVLLALVLVTGVVGIFEPSYVQPTNLLRLIRQSSFFGMMACAMVFVLAIGDVDLSVGSIYNLVATVSGVLIGDGLNGWLAAGLGIGLGGALGLTNGLLAVGLRIPVIIVTLGTLSMYQGASLILTNGAAVQSLDTTLPFFSIAGGSLGQIPAGALCFVAMAIGLHILFFFTRFGFRVQAIGSNPRAAQLAGLPVASTRILTLSLMGAVSGLAGVLTLAFLGSSDPNLGNGFNLIVIAAAIVGGTSLAGGTGSIAGALLGALLLGVIQSGLITLGVSSNWSVFVTGAVIVVAVALDYFVKRRRRRSP